MKLVQYCFSLIYPELEATRNIEYVLRVLHELFDKYVKDHNSAVEQIEQMLENALPIILPILLELGEVLKVVRKFLNHLYELWI
jgi:hypothetical protein